MSWGLAPGCIWGHCSAHKCHRLTRAQTVVSTAAKDGAGMQCGLASIDSKTGCLFFSSDIC